MCDACIPISWYHLIISPGNQINLHLSSDPEKPWINRNVIFYAFHLSIICLPRNNWKKNPFILLFLILCFYLESQYLYISSIHDFLLVTSVD